MLMFIHVVSEVVQLYMRCDLILVAGAPELSEVVSAFAAGVTLAGAPDVSAATLPYK